MTRWSHFGTRTTCGMTCDKQNLQPIEILSMPDIISKQSIEGNVVHIIKAFFFEPFFSCDQSQSDVWHLPKLGLDHKVLWCVTDESIEMVQYFHFLCQVNNVPWMAEKHRMFFRLWKGYEFHTQYIFIFMPSWYCGITYPEWLKILDVFSPLTNVWIPMRL